MFKSLLRSFVRHLLIGFLVGNLISPFSPQRAYSQFLYPQDKSHFREDTEPKKKTVSELEESIERSRFIRYKQERWNEMRRRLESGEALVPEIEKPLPTVKRKALPAPPPLGPGINVVLPYESGLSISGRKVIDFKLTSTIYAQPDSGKGRINRTDFELNQQLQVRVKGTVGRKVTVNVDFDDTREDKRDISVLYKGDPDEILQEASFGDISISLPSTQFVSYSKAVFGARAELQFRPRSGFAKLFPSALWHRYTPKQVKLFLIGSRTKGITQTKRFTGQYIMQRKEINDINYPRRQFFQLAFATGPDANNEDRPILPGSEKIFLDDQNPNNNNVDETTRTFKVLESSMTSIGGVSYTTSTFLGPYGVENTGVFKQLVPGVDYTVDYIKGVIRFIRAVQLRDVIVADYTPFNPAGTSIKNPISKDRGGVDPLINNPLMDILKGNMPILLKPDESQFFATRELKNYYVLGDKRIARDDGRGNFILRVLDVNNANPVELVGMDISSNTQTKPVLRYPENIDVDFDNGILSFVTTDTLRSPIPKPFTDDIYIYRDAVPSFKNRYKIFAEYRFRKGNYSLDQLNIVSLSEQVFVDGRKMTRDVDYFIDYDIGIVTFFRPEQIRDDSIIEITYDYSPFGGQGEETLVGMRSEWYVTDNFFLGNSVLMNFAPQPKGVPDLRSVSRSITVVEADINWKNIKFGSFPIQISNISAEVAHSIKNPNTADKALVESFEGIKLEDSANLNKDTWQVASNPEKGSPDPANLNGGYNPAYATNVLGERGIVLSNEDRALTEIVPNAPVETTDRIQVLKLDYKLPQQFEAASVVQVLSRTGLDLYTNRRQFLELWVYGDSSNSQMQVRLGGISEFSDNDNALKTEDKDRNGLLSPGEDTGWSYRNPDGSTTTIGAGNGRLDSMDLDGDGKLKGDDGMGNYWSEAGSAASPLTEPNGVVHNKIDFTGWKIIQVPLNIATTGQTEWSAVKDVRISLVNPDPTEKKGTLMIGRVAVVGTRYEQMTVLPATAPISAQAFAENNHDNPEYPSLLNHPVFNDLYDFDADTPKRREQALAIQYKRTQFMTESSTISTRQIFLKALDFSEHKKLRFFLFGDNSGSKFFIRYGGQSDYYEKKIDLNWGGTWNLIEIDIEDKNRNGQPDKFENLNAGQFPPGEKIVGAADLRKITEIAFGVLIPPGAPDPRPNKIYINEIHLTESIKIKGLAHRENVDFIWPNWGSWGANWRFVDRNFQTLTSVGSGVDSKGGGAYLSLNRLPFLPMNSNMSYSETVTPQIQLVNDPNTLIPKVDEGKSISTSQNLSGNFLMTQLPLIPSFIKRNLFNVDFSADHSLAMRSAGDQEDESFNYRYGSSYSFPWQPDILPTKWLTFKPFPTSVSYSFSQSNSMQRLSKDNTDTRSVQNNYSLRTAFQFFPQLSLSPSYSLGHNFEERGALNPDNTTTEEIRKSFGKYHKSLNQSISASGSLRVLSWFTPSFGYSINTAEAFIVNEVKFGTNTFDRGSLKTINRSSNGNVAASIAPKDIFKYIRFVRAINPMINSLSFDGGYSVSDGDTYENILAAFDSRDKLIIRGQTLDLSGQDPRSNPRRTSLTASDTSRISGRWSPFEGFTFMKSKYWAPLRNISTSGSFTETLTKRDTTGTQSFSYSKVWPDIVASTYEIERPLFLSRWMSDTRLNANYQERLSEVLEQTRSKGLNMNGDFTFTLFKLLQFSVGYRDSVSQEENLQTNQITSKTRSFGVNGQVITTLKWGNWRLTPRYDQDQSESEDGTGKKTSDIVNRNGSLQVYGDINVPRFFRLPFGKQLTMTNRLLITSSFRYAMTRNGVDETGSRDNMDSSLNGDLEITPNIRAGFGGTYTRTMNKVKREEDFQTFGFNSQVTIQF